MKLSRFVKSVLYLVFTAGLLALSIRFTVGIHTPDALEPNYFRSVGYLFILAAVLLGGALYSYMAYTRRAREHAVDSLLFGAVGLVLMGLVLFIILHYGGLESPFTESGYTAANLNVVILAALPLPFWVRTLVLVCSLREESRARCLGVQIACGVLLAGMAVALATGGLLHMVRYTETIV